MSGPPLHFARVEILFPMLSARLPCDISEFRECRECGIFSPSFPIARVVDDLHRLFLFLFPRPCMRGSSRPNIQRVFFFPPPFNPFLVARNPGRFRLTWPPALERPCQLWSACAYCRVPFLSPFKRRQDREAALFNPFFL